MAGTRYEIRHPRNRHPWSVHRKPETAIRKAEQMSGAHGICVVQVSPDTRDMVIWGPKGSHSAPTPPFAWEVWVWRPVGDS